MSTGSEIAVGQVARAAERLNSAACSGTPCAPVRDLIGDSDQGVAYAVQHRLTQMRITAGRRVVGRKIGLTARAVQEQFGIAQPDYGSLFDDMEIATGDEVPLARVLQPRCEVEIAFVMRADIEDSRVTTADILSGIEYALPAIEIVDSRIANWDIRITDTIADNASGGLFVLGHDARRIGAFDVRLAGMTLELRGEPISTGAGAACLGSPINALRWLAQTMALAGTPIRRGDVVLSGALGPMAAARPGDVFNAHVAGLGSVSIAFAMDT